MQGQDNLLMFSLVSVITFAGQQPIALEDKQISLGRPLHAQPEKSVTSAVSDGGAASDTMQVLETGKKAHAYQPPYDLKRFNQKRIRK